MLDIQFIRDNPELVAEKSRQKGYEVDIQQLLGFDKERKELLLQVEAKRRQRNELTTQTKGQKPSVEQVKVGRDLKDELGKLEHQLASIDLEFKELLKQVPNMPNEDVPIGSSEEDNVPVLQWGEIPKFDFEFKSHWEISRNKDWIDKDRASKVTGTRFAYLKGDLVKLQFALINFVIDTLTNEEKLKEIISASKLDVSSKPFVPVLPPAMIRTQLFDAMDRLEPRDDRYQVGEEKDDLWLQGSAEHTLGPMHSNETFSWVDLPVRYLGYATSFRREAGTYGKDTEGIIRMHQFDKLEMESFTTYKFGLNEHLFLIAIQEYLIQQLKIPYQVLQKCTADIGKPNARGIDIEAWLPSQNRYLETHTADFMQDYQARRLNTKVGPEPKLAPVPEYDTSNPPATFVHTNDATAFAPGRTMVAIIENFQTKDGNVKVPEVLQPYMGGKAEI